MRTITLPCEIGQKIWAISDNSPYSVNRYEVRGFKITNQYKVLATVVYGIPFEIGVNAFLTKEEALKKREELKKRDRE